MKPTMISRMKVQQVSAGSDHTIILDLNNQIWGCGNNMCGQLGLGNRKDTNQLTLISSYKFKQIATGKCHTIAIDINNNVWSFGNNYYGQLGLGSDLRAMIILIEIYLH